MAVGIGAVMGSSHEKGVDVLVVGAGIAGITAALAASAQGARVCMASVGTTFSGASFYGGTWGLGLVGPDGEGDEDDLVATILRVGGNVADPTLVRTLVHGIAPAAERLERLGVTLRRPAAGHGDEQAYVPCFDHRHRCWRGIERGPYRASVARGLRAGEVTLLEGCELVDLAEADDHICGAVLYDAGSGRFRTVACGAVVLAAGGLSGLYQQRLCAPDVTGAVHAIALRHGCSLVNVEFLQMMPTIVSPRPGIVFNEKSFGYVDGRSAGLSRDLLAERGRYGPFSARLASRSVDFAIASAGRRGMEVRYGTLPDRLPEFVRSYSAWLSAQGVDPMGPLRITHYAHASNGGIAIDARGRCRGGARGLFACGEMAGGMHGADRLGGLSSANCLVYGEIAGREAAREALGTSWASRAWRHPDAHAPGRKLPSTQAMVPADAEAMEGELRDTMSRWCMVRRDAEGLSRARRRLDGLAERATAGLVGAGDAARAADAVVTAEGTLTAGVGEVAGAPHDVARAMRLRLRLDSARAMVAAMSARQESRGAHYRSDSPHEVAELATAHVVTLDAGGNPEVRASGEDVRD